MTGYYRLILALVVAVHHAGLWPWGIRWGITCVAAFFMISGYSVSALLDRQFGPGTALPFWRDRLLRIFPQYLFWLVATSIVVFGFDRRWLFQFGRPDWINVLCNLTVFPDSFWMYIPSLAGLFILPQAWSLSIELMFYVLLPAIASWRWVEWGLVGSGLAVFVLATASVLTPEEDYSYRLLPGTLPFFLLGRAIFRRDLPMQRVILGGLLLDLLVIGLTGRLGRGFNLELLCGAPVAYAALRLAILAKPHVGDRMAGNLAYGIFLSQIWILAMLTPWTLTIPVRAAIVATGSVVLSALSFVLAEAPVNRYRRRIRQARRRGVHATAQGGLGAL